MLISSAAGGVDGADGGSGGLFELDEVYGLDESDAECIICLTDIRSIILLPCKHICICVACKKSISKCPICRARIGSYLRFTPEDAEEIRELRAAEEEEQAQKTGKKMQ